MTKVIDVIQRKLVKEVENVKEFERLCHFSTNWLKDLLQSENKILQTFASSLQETIGFMQLLNAVQEDEYFDVSSGRGGVLQSILDDEFNPLASRNDWVDYLSTAFPYSVHESLYTALHVQPTELKVIRDLLERGGKNLQSLQETLVPYLVRVVSSTRVSYKQKTKQENTNGWELLSKMSSSLDLPSLFRVLETTEGFALQCPDKPEESCLTKLVTAYFSSNSKAPPKFFEKVCKKMIDLMMTCQIWPDLLHVAEIVKSGSVNSNRVEFPSWLKEKIKVVEAVNNVWSKTHFHDRDMIYEYLDGMESTLTKPKVLELIEAIRKDRTVFTRMQSILLLERAHRVDAVTAIAPPKEEEDEEDLCPICFARPLQDDNELACEHRLCNQCFLAIMETENKYCPFCRDKLKWKLDS